MAEETPMCGKKRKSFERGDVKVLLPNKKFQSPVVITAPDGRTATKTKSRLPLFATDSGDGDDQIKQQFLSRISQAESLLNQKRVSSSQETLLHTLCKPGFTTPRKPNHGATTPNPFSFMTPMNTGRRRDSLSGRRDSVSGRRDFVSGRRDSVCGRRDSLSARTPFQGERQLPCTQLKSRLPMSGRKMRMRASMQLRMAESQELQASRIAQAKRELWMDRQERAYSVWLNHLLKQPMDATAKVSAVGSGREIRASVESSGRSSAGFGVGIGSLSFDRERSQSSGPSKVLSDILQTPTVHDKQNRRVLSKAQLSSTRMSRALKENKRSDPQESMQETHLSQICSASELWRRLGPYLEPAKCERVVSTMTQLAKYIDEGRLRMKPNCVVLSDVALRQKALDVLFSYAPAWLQLGLVIVLGPIALTNTNYSAHNVTENEGGTQTDLALLEVLIEEHFFADSTLAKRFATNRSIDGLYRDGYKEALGKLILKRIFLLILVLDKIKCEMVLNGAHGIDGIDGGSPLLFQQNGVVKSSRQALEDCLSHVMQGEGDLIVHVGKLGYHVSHIQAPLCEYNFEVMSLVEDLQDGIRLCRLAQLMSRDVSILAKIKLPCHMPKKRVHNCEVALESLGRAGVLLQDEQGALITAEHLASGQREKTLSLMWNVVLHLQIPRLVSHPKLFQEIEHVGLAANHEAKGYAVLDLLLAWVQACALSPESFDMGFLIRAISSNFGSTTVQNFSTSFADGRVLCYLVSNYLPQCLPHHAIWPMTSPASGLLAEQGEGLHGRWELQSLQGSGNIAPGDRDAAAHNFGMVDEAAKMLGIASEMLLLSDLVDGDPRTGERNVIIFVAHLCSALLNADPQAAKCVVPTTSKEEVVSSGPDPHAAPSSGHDAALENAAVCIQAWYKGQRQRRSFTRVKMNVATLQRFVRGWLAKKRSRGGFEVCGGSDEVEDVVVLQGYGCEGRRQWENLEVLVKHVTRVQGWAKTRKLRSTFLLQRRGTTTIQRHWRGSRARKEELKQACAVTIQAWWRGCALRRSLSTRSAAACVIQKHFRGHAHRSLYWKRVAGITRLQALVRGYMQRKLYWMHRTQIIRVQAVMRGGLARKRSKLMQRAVRTIQSAWRRQHARRVAGERRAAASIWIQACYRGFRQRQRYKLCCAGITRLQAVARGHLARKRLRGSRDAAIRIQAAWRGHLVRRTVAAEQTAAVLIQRHVRGYHQRRWYQSCRARCVQVLKVQSVWRGRQVRATMQRRQAAATVIQSWIRGWLARMRVRAAKKAAIAIQSVWHGALARAALRRKTAAAVHIQSCFRGCSQRQQYRTLGEAALVIQSIWRGVRGRRSVQAAARAATLIQRCYRGYCQKKLFHVHRSRVVAVQAAVRGYLARRRLRAAKDAVLKIQAYWCRHRVRRSVQRMGHAAARIQACFRGFRQRKGYRLLQAGALRMQGLVRGFQARKALRVSHAAAVRIQAAWRGFHVRRMVRRMVAAAVIVQSGFRGCRQRKEYETWRKSAVCIQAAARGCLMRRRNRVVRAAALTIQSRWCGFTATRALRRSLAAVQIQRHGRMATIIQSAYRSYVQRRLYHKERAAVVRLQAVARGRLARRRARSAHEAATRIQARWRGSHARKAARIQRIAATKIQCHFRGFVQKRAYRSVIRALRTIQIAVRGWLRRKDYHARIQEVRSCSGDQKGMAPERQLYAAASTIQAHWRGHNVRKTSLTAAAQQIAEQHESGCDSAEEKPSMRVYDPRELEAGRTLTLWAGSLRHRLEFLRQRRSAMVIQRVFRGWKARKHYARVTRCLCLIQALWRGHKWRTGQSRVKQHMQELRLRMQSTAAAVDNSQRLGNRLTEALAQLLSQKTVSGILNTCATIDIATEHSKQCCERLAEGGAINKLFQLIQTTNRSPPHEQVLKHALSILANLARFPDLALCIASEPDSINILAEQLLIFRNKEEVFAKAMKVLQHVCHTPGCAEIIQSDAVVMRRLQNVALMLERKFEVDRRNLEKLPPSAHSSIRSSADRKLQETVQHHQSVASILPGIAPKKPARAGAPKAPPPTGGRPHSVRSATPCEKPSEGSRPAAAPAPPRRRDSISSAAATPKPGGRTRGESLSGRRPPWGASPTPKAAAGDQRDSVPSVTSLSSRAPRPPWGAKAAPQEGKAPSAEVRASQSRLPRVPLKDRSNHGTQRCLQS